MARPNREGLDYFPCDCDFFLDEKIAAVGGEFGLKAECIFIHLLCAIYRRGYFIEWGEMLQMKLLKELPGVKVELLNDVVMRLVKWNVFDSGLFSSASILTSRGIQRRYFEATRRRKNQNMQYYLLDDSAPPKGVNVCNNSVNVCNNSVNVCNNSVNVDINSQSKVKKSKLFKENVKESLQKPDNNSGQDSVEDNLPLLPKTPPPEEAEKEKSSAKREKAMAYLNEHYPRVQNVEDKKGAWKILSYEQLMAAIGKYGRDRVLAVLSEMENWKQLKSKNNTANLTMLNWLRREEERQSKNDDYKRDKVRHGAIVYDVPEADEYSGGF